MEIQNHVRNKKRGESLQHVKIKRYFMKRLPHDNEITNIKEEARIGNRIADIYCHLSNDMKIVVEVQHSMIMVKDLLQRTKEYNENDCHVLWVFNATSFDRFPKNQQVVQILNFEKICHRLYQGRIYYINVQETGFHTPLYPLHFNLYHEERLLPIGFDYYRKSYSKRSTILGDLSSLKLKLFKNSGYMLARFYDENIRNKCEREINAFLKNEKILLKIINSNVDISDKQKLLCAIIGKFGQAYGVDLIYDVLRQRFKVEMTGDDLHLMKSYFSNIK